MKRCRKVTPSQFLESLIFKSFDNRLGSLNDLSTDLQVHQGITMRKQSLDERFNEHSVKFVKALMEEQLQTQITNKLSPQCLKRFTAVKIKDSTRFQLPPSLQDKYPGSGGSASPAGVHIQFEFDLKTGTVNTIRPTNARRQDSTDAIETISEIQQGELIIRDLGYFVAKVLKQIETDRNAYYIIRMTYGLKVYRYRNGKYIELILEEELKAMRAAGIASQEVEVYLDKKLENPIRLVMEVLPDHEIERRVSKAREYRAKKGKQLTKDYRVYASMGLFLTNIPKDWVKADELRLLYKLRWQIELRFKCWKGLSHIHANRKMKIHRFETSLYAQLIYILLHWEISMTLTALHWKKNKILISVYKCYKALIQCKDLLRNALFKNRSKLKDYFNLLENLRCKNLQLEKRKYRVGLSEILMHKLK
jgi:hypothetical protein